MDESCGLNPRIIEAFAVGTEEIHESSCQDSVYGRFWVKITASRSAFQTSD
jgi:hypothetical protein